MEIVMKTSMYNHRQNVFEVQTALRALWSAEDADTRINHEGKYGGRKCAEIFRDSDNGGCGFGNVDAFVRRF